MREQIRLGVTLTVTEKQNKKVKSKVTESNEVKDLTWCESVQCVKHLRKDKYIVYNL